jgi:Ca2+-binding EF-hand superfamily protein
VVLQSCVQESNIKFNEDQMEELVDAFFEETDADQNGQITFEEFSSFLSKFPGVADNLTIA